MGALGNLTSGSALPPMSGFDANAVAKALGAVGGNAPSGVTPGVPEKMVNPLAQMLAGQGPAYKPPDTTWGIAGDRLRRFTPQEGNVRGGTGGGAGGAGGGELPPMNSGESSMDYMLRIGMSQADADAALAMSKANPGMSFQEIRAKLGGGAGGSGGYTPPGSVVAPGGPVTIDWGKLGARLDQNGTPVPVTPPPAPTGAPAINTAMEKLKAPTTGQFTSGGVYTGPVPTNAEVAQYRDAWKASMVQPEGFRQWTRAQKDAWNANRSAAEKAYVEIQKRTGLGPGGYVLG
jgi:hypothetical protein